MLQREHSAILSTFIKLPFVIKSFVLSILEWPFYTGFTVCKNVQSSHLKKNKIYSEECIKTHMHIFRPRQKHMQSLKKIGLNCRESCAHQVPLALKAKIRKRTKIRNRYNQAPHLTQDTNGTVITSQLDITNERQEVSLFQAGDHKALINNMGKVHKMGKARWRSIACKVFSFNARVSLIIINKVLK